MSSDAADGRLSLPEDDELDQSSQELLATLPPLNVARMLARTGIAPQFYGVLSKMFAPEWFPPDDREVLLFRTCRANSSSYEIAQHQAFGILGHDTIAAVLGDAADLTPWHRQLCSMADEMADDAKLSPASVQELVAHYGTQNMASRAIFLMAWFNMLSRFVDSTGLPLEGGEDPYRGINNPTARS